MKKTSLESDEHNKMRKEVVFAKNVNKIKI